MKKQPKQSEEERLMYRLLRAMVDSLKSPKPAAFLLDVETQKVLYDYFVKHGFNTDAYKPPEQKVLI